MVMAQSVGTPCGESDTQDLHPRSAQFAGEVTSGLRMKFLMKFSATGSSRDVGITLPGNGVPAGLAGVTVSGGATARPAGSFDCEKSPARSSALGATTLENVELATCRVPSMERK